MEVQDLRGYVYLANVTSGTQMRDKMFDEADPAPESETL